MNSWTPTQRKQLRAALDAGETVAYVVTDQHGRPSNGGSATQAESGAVHTAKGPLRLCSVNAVHGTLHPHRWAGCRVWVAVFASPVERDDSKVGSLKRTIIGELLPEDTVDSSVAIRLGMRGANLRGADLGRADLGGANLGRADLSGANLSRANLGGADLSGANLGGADLGRADLSRANLSRANLRGADLSRANLGGADLSRADLRGAYLSRAYLSRADLSGAYRPEGIQDGGWTTDPCGYLQRKVL